jgi:NAD(P)-dependent dehydrogenase (short-subunit alcohol dehydrogenase family)
MLGQEVLPKFGARGSIINITSLSHTMPVNDYTAYSASKGGVLGLAKSDAYDYGPESIRVNCIAPGMTVTPMLVEAYGDEGLRQLASVTPLRRNATPDDVAHAITWLSGPRASFITGSTITVDGGFNLRNGPP